MEFRLFLFLSLFLVHSGTLAQQIISGSVKDRDGKPLCNAHILDIDSRSATVTDEFGKFQLSVSDSGSTLRISHVGFRPVLEPIPALDYYDLSMSQNVSIRLEQESTLLSMVRVRPRENAVTKGQRGIVLHDFSLADENLLLMAQDGIRYLMFCDDDWSEISRLRVDQKGYRLYEDCLGNVHLFGEDSVYQITIQDNRVNLDFAFEQSYFKEQLAHCSTSSDSHIFFSSYGKAGQEVYHYGLHRETKDGIILQRVFDHVGLKDIEDHFNNLPQQWVFDRRFRQAGSSFENERLGAMQELSCSNNGFVAGQGAAIGVCVDQIAINRYRRFSRPLRGLIASQVPIDGGLRTTGQYFESVSNRQLEQQAMMTSWSLSARDRGWLDLLSKPTYSPMLTLRDSVFVFDHVVGVAYVHDMEGNQVRSFPLEHHEHKGWRNQLVPDENGEKLYAHVKQQNTIYLVEVDLNDGSLLRSAQLSNAMFVNNLKVKDGYAYYLKEFRDIHKSDQMMRQKL